MLAHGFKTELIAPALNFVCAAGASRSTKSPPKSLFFVAISLLFLPFRDISQDVTINMIKWFPMKTAIRLTIILLCVLFLSCLSTGCRCPLLCPTLYKYSFLFPALDGVEKEAREKKILNVLRELSNEADLQYEGMLKYPDQCMGFSHFFQNKKERTYIHFNMPEERIYVVTTSKSEYFLRLLKALKGKLDLESLEHTLEEEEEILPFWSFT